ncbi:50S ribosomal protein L24 [Candidatus Dojkabacteria bacterium]|nr:50S ribosomal protein L24 [Candidatus Dojkabacteria bacterium]
MNMKVRVGDKVKVLYGKNRGKTGNVLRVLKSKGMVVVEDVNVYKKHIKGNNRDVESQIAEIIKPVAVSKVMVICPNCEKPTRIGFKADKDGKVRICKKCNKEIESGAEVKSEKSDKKSKKAPKVKVAGDIDKGDEKQVDDLKKGTKKVKGPVKVEKAQSYRKQGDM